MLPRRQAFTDSLDSCWLQCGLLHAGRRPDDKVTFDKDLPQYDLEEGVPLEVPSGSLVLLHGALVHFSYENSSGRSRLPLRASGGWASCLRGARPAQHV